MSARRLSVARVAGVAAWTAASVSWGTAAVAIAAKPAEATAAGDPLVFALPEVTTTTAAVPDMPESGLVVLRYTPVARPEPQVVIREVRTAAPSTSGTPAPAPAAPKTKTQSSGS